MERPKSIQEIYIIHESGICLVAKTCHEKAQEVELLSGFLVAISDFARSMLFQEVQEIKMENMKIIYDMKESIMIALVISDLRISKRKFTHLMEKIRTSFITNYEKHLKEGIIDPSVCKGFDKTLNKWFDGISQGKMIDLKIR